MPLVWDGWVNPFGAVTPTPLQTRCRKSTYMSALGQKRTCRLWCHHVRFAPGSGHPGREPECLLCARTRLLAELLLIWEGLISILESRHAASFLSDVKGRRS